MTYSYKTTLLPGQARVIAVASLPTNPSRDVLLKIPIVHVLLIAYYMHYKTMFKIFCRKWKLMTPRHFKVSLTYFVYLLVPALVQVVVSPITVATVKSPTLIISSCNNGSSTKYILLARRSLQYQYYYSCINLKKSIFMQRLVTGCNPND